jgi:hypothetical protein
MMSVRRVLSFVGIGALLGACATQAPPTAPAPRSGVPSAAAAKSTFVAAHVEVVSAQFGVYGADNDGRRVLFETDNFPAITAAPYGWFIIFKADKPTVTWREEFELPTPLANWGPGEAMGVFMVSPDRKTAVTERIIPTRLGFVGNEWRYAPGDPVGAHKMRIYIDGQLIREFTFDIQDGPGNSPRGTPRGGGAGSRT